MPFCGNCGHPLSDTDLTCPNCGEIRPNAIPKPDSVTQEPTAPTPDIPEEPLNTKPEQNNFSTATQQAAAPEIPNEVPPQAQNTAEPHATPDFSAYDIRHNPAQPNTASQQTTTEQPSYNYNYTPAPNTPLTNNNSNGMGIASLILGICSIAICCCYGVGAIPAIIGLILGILQNKKNANGIATAGIVLGIIGILLNVVWLIYMVILFSDGGLQDVFDEFSSTYDDYSYYDDSAL